MPMMTIGLDISKSWFQIHWITEDGEIVRKKLARAKVLDFFSRLPSCFVGLEASVELHARRWHGRRQGPPALSSYSLVDRVTYMSNSVQPADHELEESRARWAAKSWSLLWK